MFFSIIQKHNPFSSAVITGNKSYNYSKIIREIRSCFRNLEKFSIHPGDHAAILSNNEFEFIPLLFALWNSGAVPVLVNTKLTEKEIREKISFADCRYVFIHRELAEKSNLNLHDRIIFPFAEKFFKEKFVFRKTSANETAVIIFTSGSSGKPKGVMLNFNNLMKSALIGNKVLGINTNDRLLASLPFYHIGGFSIIMRAFLFGASIIIPASVSAKDLIESLRLFNPTLTSLVSNQLKKFVDEKIIPPKELRLILLGGGFFDKDLILQAIARGWKTAKVYGSTETSSFISFMNTEEVKRYPTASGKALLPNKIIITKEGEVAVKSPAVMKGYYKNDRENNLKLKNGYYYTGDTGYLDNEGYLYIEAKRRDLIVSGGENINPAEIENAIFLHPQIKEVSVVGIEEPRWGEMLCAVVVLKENGSLQVSELKNFLKGKIAAFKIPKQVIFADSLPKTELGKIELSKVQEIIKKI